MKKKPKESIVRWCLFHSGEHVKVVRVRCYVVPKKRRAKK